MSLFTRRRGPTHADALMASRSVMKQALTEIAFYAKDEDSARIAVQALDKQKRVYVAGVMRAVD